MTRYTDFVKQSYPEYKKNNPNTNSKDILKMIANSWNENKKTAPVVAPSASPAPRKPRAKKAPIVEINGPEGLKEMVDNIQDNGPPVEVSKKARGPARQAKKQKRTNPEEAVEVAP